MDWLFDFLAIWLSINTLIISTAWYATMIIPHRWPHWWRQVVVDIEPDYRMKRSR